MYKKHKLVILPTDKKSIITKDKDFQYLTVNNPPLELKEGIQNYELYIIEYSVSIRKGDFVIEDNKVVQRIIDTDSPKYGNKIIASTADLTIYEGEDTIGNELIITVPKISSTDAKKYVNKYTLGFLPLDVLVSYKNIWKWNEEIETNEKYVILKEPYGEVLSKQVIEILKEYNVFYAEQTSHRVSDFLSNQVLEFFINHRL